MKIDNFTAQSIFYFFFVLALLFLSPFGTAVLTVNEELFVFLSFLIFFDFLGGTLMGGAASTADTKIIGLTLRQTALLKTKLVSAVRLRGLIQTALRPAQFRYRLRQNFVEDLATLVATRELELSTAIAQAALFAHKVIIRQELGLVRSIFAGGLIKAVLDLRTKLLKPVTEAKVAQIRKPSLFFTRSGSLLVFSGFLSKPLLFRHKNAAAQLC